MELKVILSIFAVTRIYLKCTVLTLTLYQRAVLSLNFKEVEIMDCWYKDVCTEKCTDACIRYKEMLMLLEQSNIPEVKWKPVLLKPESVDYDSFCDLADYKDNIKSHIESGHNLAILSENTGNGKTTWAIKLMLRYFNEIWAGNGFRCRGIFINVPTFLATVKLQIEKKSISVATMLDNLSKVDLVIWDDIASTKLTAYEHSQLLNYIDQRILTEKSNIFTGNIVSESALQNALGARLASRVLSSQIIELKGRDRRYGTVANNL